MSSKSYKSVSEKNEFEKRKAEELCVWVNANLDKPIELKDLVEASELSHFEILRIFSVYFKTTPMQWIRQQREAQGKGKNYFETQLEDRSQKQVATFIPNNLKKKELDD